MVTIDLVGLSVEWTSVQLIGASRAVQRDRRTLQNVRLVSDMSIVSEICECGEVPEQSWSPLQSHHMHAIDDVSEPEVQRDRVEVVDDVDGGRVDDVGDVDGRRVDGVDDADGRRVDDVDSVDDEITGRLVDDVVTGR